MKTKLGAVIAAALVAAPLAANAQMTPTPGFYVGAEGGVNFLDHRISGVDEKIGFAAGGIVGYDFVGPRVELEGAYRYNKLSIAGFGGSSKTEQFTIFANVLYDFFTDSMFSPHLGIGAGVNIWDVKGGGPDGTDFAMQGIAGIGVKFTSGLFLSLDYKFVYTFASGLKDFYNHTGMLTVGYKFGPPAPAAPPPIGAAPPGVSFIVFFDFDRANLTAQAVTTIKQAAAAAKSGNKTRIGVTGHADRSGTDAYNMALSLRRANAVKDQLVREGIPAANITVVGRGESQPLVPTADGVREPQNRRVEIVLN